MLHKQFLRHTAQIKALAAGQHGDRHFANLCGGENKLHMGGRLFQRFQQAVESRFGKHVHLINDKHLIAGTCRTILHAFDNVTNIVNARMAGRVHLDHVHMARFHNGLAVLAKGRHVHRWCALITIHRFIVKAARHNPRRGGFAHPAHPCQHIGLGNAPLGKGIGQGFDQRRLANQIIKGGGAIFAGEDAIALISHISSSPCAGLVTKKVEGWTSDPFKTR